jgi:hypothetical protein
MFSPKYRSIEVINNPARLGSNHREVNCINYSNTITIIIIVIVIVIIIIKKKKKKLMLMRTLRWKINVRIKK